MTSKTTATAMTALPLHTGHWTLDLGDSVRIQLDMQFVEPE
ncbi:hypothetical protein [Streptosporangium sp. NPDC003464]